MSAGAWGIVVEVIGAGWIVGAAWRGRASLTAIPPDVTYDTLGPAINKLMLLVRTQFVDQLKGFALLAIGLLLQLYGTLA